MTTNSETAAGPQAQPAGLVVVDKPAGLTSHDVVARIRRLAGTRKVGHAGTLDPMATGVLLVGIGRATRLLGYLAATGKSYAATIRLGAATTTDDAEGEVISRGDVTGVDESALRRALGEQTGWIQQRPSSVSAVKIDGKRAYQRVREGEQVDIAPRRVLVENITLDAVRRTESYLDVDVEVTCSSGTYIRAIARDVGQELGVGGHLTALRRWQVGDFSAGEALTLEELSEHFDYLAIEEVARRAFRSRTLTEAEAAGVRVGKPLPIALEANTALFDPAGEFLALYEPVGETSRPLAVFVG